MFLTCEILEVKVQNLCSERDIHNFIIHFLVTRDQLGSYSF